MKTIELLTKYKGNRIRIFLINGFQKVVFLNEVEDDYILVEDEKTGRENIIFKHAISTIAL